MLYSIIKILLVIKNTIMTSLRKEWFLFVGKTRKKMSRGSKVQVSHREAMKKASEKWPKEKEKILRRIKREEKSKTVKTHPAKKPKAPDSDEKT